MLGEVDVSEDNCEDLLAAADMFAMNEVMTACSTFLKERLQPENCIGKYVFTLEEKETQTDRDTCRDTQRDRQRNSLAD